MNSIIGLIHSARDAAKYAEFTESGVRFSATEKNGRVQIRVNGLLKSREASEKLLRELRVK